MTGILGTGLRALNSMDAEDLPSKISSATSNLQELESPLPSSLSALGTNQCATEINTSLALSCILSQLWVQSTVAVIVRGERNTLLTEVGKVIWDNATKFEKKFQSWWHLVNFVYNPTNSKDIAFVLRTCNASVYTIYQIIVLGLKHHGIVPCPLEHRVLAQQNGKEWPVDNVDACVVWEQGFICESNTIKVQDICLDTEQNICHFEIHPD